MTVKKKDLHRTQHAPAKLIIALGSTLLGAIWLWIKDPIPVILGSTATEAVAPWWYMLSAFPVLGLLLFDGWTMLHENGLRGKTIGFGAEVMLVVAVSFLRIELMLPISGHALLFSYALFHWFAASGRRHSLELAVAAGLFLMVCGMKLFWWRDPVTLGLGVLLAAALVIPRVVSSLHGNR